MRRLIRYFAKTAGNLSLKYKLFILLLTISIIPTVLVFNISQNFMFRSSIDYSSSISSQYARFVSKDIRSYLQELDQSFDKLFANFQFQRYLETPADDLKTQANYAIDFLPIIRNSLQFRNEVPGVLYLDELNKVLFESYQKRLDDAYDLNNDPVYNAMIGIQTPTLSPPHPMTYTLGSNEHVFSFIRPVVNLNTGLKTAWFVVEIKEEKIINMLSERQSPQEGHLFLYQSGTGQAVSSVEMGDALLADFRTALESQPEGHKKFLFNSDQSKYEASYEDVGYGDWKLAWIAPLESMTHGVQKSYQVMIIVSALSLIVSLFIAFPVMNTVLRPLFRLIRGMQRVGKGAYDPIPIQHGHDEFGFLIRSYNRMLHELQQMEQEVYQTKIKEKERELLQLQAQINPHFLFNTLETIESYAVKNNGEAVGEMVQAVSKMMRYNVRNDNGWAPVREEIAYIRYFLRIHYYRNNRELPVQFAVTPEAMDIPIMKLSIQPFVENAIKYGWNPRMDVEEFDLSIHVDLIGDRLRIVVQDTGTGMDPEVLRKLSRMIAAKGEDTDAYFQKHTGIYNVYRRFLLAYEDIDFHVESSGDGGTRVEIGFPVHQRTDS